MAFPICNNCARSGILCPDCQQKVRKDNISELDVLVSSILAHHGATGYESLIDFGNKLIVFASDKDTKTIIGQKGMTVAELSKKVGRRVVVLSRVWNKETIVRSLARPSKLAAINKIFKEDGTELLKLIFDKPIDEGSLKLMKELVGDIEVAYEEKNEKDAHVR